MAAIKRVRAWNIARKSSADLECLSDTETKEMPFIDAYRAARDRTCIVGASPGALLHTRCARDRAWFRTFMVDTLLTTFSATSRVALVLFRTSQPTLMLTIEGPLAEVGLMFRALDHRFADLPSSWLLTCRAMRFARLGATIQYTTAYLFALNTRWIFMTRNLGGVFTGGQPLLDRFWALEFVEFFKHITTRELEYVYT